MSAFSSNIAAPALETKSKSIVMPLHVYAASRRAFDVVVRGDFTDFEAKAEVFTYLPLYQHGWNERATYVRRIAIRDDGAIFRVEEN